MRISVIIPAHPSDRFDMILRAVDSIKIQNYPDKEVIVAVGGNPKLAAGLKDVLPDDVTVLHDPNGRGPSRTRNLGITGATGDVIAFLEDDAISDVQWLNSLAENYRDSSVMAVGGLVRPLWHNKTPLWFPEELLWVVGCTYSGHPTTRTDIRSLPGCNMSFRHEVFEHMGPFNTDFGRAGNLIGAEDTESFIRMKIQFPLGKIIWDPSVLVHHNVPVARQSVKYIVRRSYGEGMGRARIERMYPRSLTVESTLLRYIFFKSIPTRVKKLFNGGDRVLALSQISLVMLSVIVTGLSYSLARLTQGFSHLQRT